MCLAISYTGYSPSINAKPSRYIMLAISTGKHTLNEESIFIGQSDYTDFCKFYYTNFHIIYIR